MYEPPLASVLVALHLNVLPYSVVSMATLSTALTIALCFAFALSATVFLLLGKQTFHYIVIITFSPQSQAVFSSLP
jgi:hypothetical protein